jgi:carbonic anhydrase
MITLILAVYLLGVNRILLMPHTDCGVTKVTDDDIHARAARRQQDHLTRAQAGAGEGPVATADDGLSC